MRSWFRSSHMDRDVLEELAFHIEREAEERRESGMPPAEAWRTARIAVGGVAALQEESRDARPGAGVRRLLRELGFAARQLRRDRWYAAGAITTLGLSVGTATAIYSALYAMVLHPLAVPDVDRLVVGWESFRERNLPLVELSYRYVEELTAGSRSFVSAAAMGSSTWPTVLDIAEEPLRVSAAGVTASFFSTVGVAPLHGRAFSPDDDRPHAPRVVILSHALWTTRFGGDLGLMGRTVQIGDDPPSRVIGVMPAGYAYPPQTDLWLPVVPVLAGSGDDPEAGLSTVGALFLIGRLRDGVTPVLARDELNQIAGALGSGGHRIGSSFMLTPIVNHLLGPVRSALWGLLLAVLILVVIGCANVSVLMLTRLARQQRELAVRQALGASRAVVGRIWLAQAVLLSASGGLFGLLMARGMIAAIVMSAPLDLARINEVTVSGPVAGFTFGLVMLTTLLCGAVPMREAGLTNLADALAGGGRVTSDRRSHRWRGRLLTGQAALTVVLLVGAALVIRSFINLRALDLGFDPAHVIALHVEPQAARSTNAWVDRLIQRLSERGDVEAVGAASLRPLRLGTIGEETSVVLDGQPETVQALRRNPMLNLQVATSGYFKAMGIRLKEGRVFTADDTARTTRVALVGESTARRLWPPGSALGRRVLLSGHSPVPSRAWRTVVGVVADVRYRGLDDVRLDVYDCALQSEMVASDLTIRSWSDPATLSADVLAEARRLDSRALVDGVTTMDRVVARAQAPWRFSVWIFAVFAAVALLLTGVGLFSAVTLDGVNRRRELAIQLALGAAPAALAREILRRWVRQLLPGVAVGLAVSVVMARVWRGSLFDAHIDPSTFVGVGLFVVVLTIGASLVPALLAIRVDPVTLLSVE